MANLSIVSREEGRENKVIRSRVAKRQQPDAERLMNKSKGFKIDFFKFGPHGTLEVEG